MNMEFLVRSIFRVGYTINTDCCRINKVKMIGTEFPDTTAWKNWSGVEMNKSKYGDRGKDTMKFFGTWFLSALFVLVSACGPADSKGDKKGMPVLRRML